MHVGCPACGTINRVPDERPSGEPVCGRCGAELMAATPASLSDATFERYITRVQLFAQELRTPAPVSVKRLQKLWEAV